MLPFIEVTTRDEKKLLINVNVITTIQVTRGKTYVRYKPGSGSAATDLEVKEDYEAIKRQLSRSK